MPNEAARGEPRFQRVHVSPMVDPVIDASGPFSYLAKPNTTIGVMAGEWASQVTFDGAICAGAAHTTRKGLE